MSDNATMCSPPDLFYGQISELDLRAFLRFFKLLWQNIQH